MPDPNAAPDGKLIIKLKTLESKKQMLFQRFQTVYDYIKDLDKPKVVEYFNIGKTRLEQSLEELSQVVENINLISLEINPDFNPTYQAVEAANNLYCHILSAATKLRQGNQDSSTSPTSLKNVKALPKLPKIELIEFSGDPKTWPIFYENFKSCVHDNKELDDSCKIHYLLSKLGGRALTLCSGITPIASNYGTLWKMLVDTFQDERLLATTYLRSILDFKPLNAESASSLNSFLEKFDVSVSALKQIRLPDLADFLLVSLALSKLDSHTQRIFEMSLAVNEIPTYNKLIAFIRQQAKVLGRTTQANASSHTASGSTHNKSFSKQKHSYSYVSSNVSNTASREKSIHFACPVCNQTSHTINKCTRFLRFTPTERYNTVKNKVLCLNCLSPRHKVSQCKSLTSCTSCGSRHHTLIHFGQTHIPNVPDLKLVPVNTEKKAETSISHVVSNIAHSSDKTSLLPTAKVLVFLPNKQTAVVRMLLDSGSQSNFITADCCSRLKLPVSRKVMSVVGIGSLSQPVKGLARNITFSSCHNLDIKFQIDALVLDSLSVNLPTENVSVENSELFKGLQLADGEFDESAAIDGILGANIFCRILTGKRVMNQSGSLLALETSLGYTVVGEATSTSQNFSNALPVIVDPAKEESLESIVADFFRLEEVPETFHHSLEEVECENHFLTHYSRDCKSGKYTVSLPFRIDPANLGDSLTSALKRFLVLEKKLESSHELYEQYRNIIQDYLNQDHLCKVQDLVEFQKFNQNSPSYFIPHHAIFKSSSSSTPVRIVFDASAKTFPSSLSLNDCLHTGPKLQIDIVQMFLNFRLFEVAIIADLCQMYRQIRLDPNDHKFQRILWRFTPDEPISIYALTTVAFGIKTSPYLALRTIRQLALDEAHKFHTASKVVLRDMYIDDLTTSIENIENAKQLYIELIDLFKAGGFDITKWHTNSEDLLSLIPQEKRSIDLSHFENSVLKVLGIQWQSNSDILSFSINLIVHSAECCTKRFVLSQISKIYDPLGILGPVVLYAKNFIRKLWSIKLGWDSNIPQNLAEKWVEFENELPLLKQLSVPRWLGVQKDSSVTLIGFCDSSQTAYGCVIYLRVMVKNKIRINLVCSKSKLAPLKTISIPRLELCAALLLSKLMKYVHDLYSSRCKIEQIITCTDSQIVLGWLAQSPHKWKTFVANRISKIQTNLPATSWFFVQGKDNISDIISRGLLPSSLISCQGTWLNGPSWLKHDSHSWPIHTLNSMLDSEELPEKSVSLISQTEVLENIFYSFICRFSSFSKLLRSMVFVLRFLKILPLSGEITTADLEKSEQYLIKVVQRLYFEDILLAFSKENQIPQRYRQLCPFIDENGIIRVGGRLHNAQIGFDFKHPYLIPKNEHFGIILVDYLHKSHFHTGPHLLSSIIRKKYWILSSRHLIRQRIRRCNFCFKFKPKPNYPLMANLPSPRVNVPVKPFIDTGVDYAGPLHITLTRHRGIKTQKAYICLFVCLATKCVHLELASDLTTATFLDALKRFLSRRGPIKTLYSDQGTNFIGAKRALDEFDQFVNSSDYNASLKDELLKHSISWKFNTPLAPHMGGLWEANVKSMKSHLFKAIGSQILSYEELNTVLTQIEALLNSRPLCSFVSNDPSDPEVLTPAHFTLTPLQNFPASYDVLNININRLNRKQLLDQIVQSYWTRWKNEYLHQLQTRSKWNSSSNPVKIGTVVMLMDENGPPLKWSKGIISEIFPGKDGIIRIASVKTQHGSYKRPVVKLCPLPTQ